MKVFWLSLLLCAISLAFAQLPPQLMEIPLPQNPDMVTGTLSNGLTYYIIHNPKPAKHAELRLFVGAGSVNEDNDQLGLAHFTEHMAFNGTKNFKKTEVVDYLNSIGMGFANGLNAMTSYDFTMYELKIPTDKKDQLEKGFLILSDMAHQLSYDPAELERERGVIIEEWRMGQNAMSRVNDRINKVRFAGSRYASQPPIGSYDVLSSFKRDQILRFYKDWYRPDLQSVVVVGDISTDDALAMINKYFASIPASVNPRPVQDFSVPSNPTPRAVIAIDPELPYTMINATWQRNGEPFQTVGDFYKSLQERLFFVMLNERLGDLSQSENPPFSMAFGQSNSILRGYSATNLMAFTETGKNLGALRVLLTEAERVRRHGFLESEFARAKINYIRTLEAEVEKSSTRESEDIVWELFDTLTHKHQYLSAEQILGMAYSLLESISLESVNAVVDDLITEDNLTISYSSSEKAGVAHPTEADLLAVFGEVAKSEIEAYVDNETTEPLLAEIPSPGKIIKKKTYPASGIKKWTLSNGATVYSKQTNFKSDEILFSAKSPGGYSKYPAEDIFAAQLLGNYSSLSGVGEFDNTALLKILAGKIAGANLDVRTYYERLEGSASPRDLEVLFQLIHQYSTNPRFDSKGLSSFIGRMKPWYQNNLNDPQQVFADSLESLIYANHYLRRPLRVEHIENLQLEQLRRIHNDRYADFSDFSFFFVGNFDEKQLETFACTYLANLPTARRKDKIFDAGIRTFKGKQDVRFKKGSNESSIVSHVTTGDFKVSDDNKVAMNAMIMVLNEKLRENIREERSGVYAIQAWHIIESNPKPFYTLRIWMSCAPERVDELNTAIFATIDSIRLGLFDERYVVSSKAVLEKRFEENIMNNDYWLNNMENNALSSTPIDGFLGNPSRYAKINKQSITKAAKQYLVFDKNKLSMIMDPEIPIPQE